MATRDTYKIEKLDVGNWRTWSFHMKNILAKDNLADSLADDSATPQSKKALALICLNVKDFHIPKLIDKTTAKEAWEALRALADVHSAAGKLQVLNELLNLKFSFPEDGNITVYFSRVQEIKNKLVNISENISDNLLLLLALKGLPDVWKTEKAVLMSTTTGDLTFEDVFAKLLAAEKRNEDTREEELSAVALVAKARGYKMKQTRTCHLCGERGHLMADCDIKKAKEKREKAGLTVAL